MPANRKLGSLGHYRLHSSPWAKELLLSSPIKLINVLGDHHVLVPLTTIEMLKCQPAASAYISLDFFRRQVVQAISLLQVETKRSSVNVNVEHSFSKLFV